MRPLGTALENLGPTDSDSTVNMTGDGRRGGRGGGGCRVGGMMAASVRILVVVGVDRERSRRLRLKMMKNLYEV